MNNSAHRFSRHVSFQAVVPPAVGFPMNYHDYSGPSFLQASSHIETTRQNLNGDADAHSPAARSHSVKVKKNTSLKFLERQKSASYILVNNGDLHASPTVSSAPQSPRLLSVVEEGCFPFEDKSSEEEIKPVIPAAARVGLTKLVKLFDCGAGFQSQKEATSAISKRLRRFVLGNKKIIAVILGCLIVLLLLLIVVPIALRRTDGYTCTEFASNRQNSLDSAQEIGSIKSRLCESIVCIRVALQLQNLVSLLKTPWKLTGALSSCSTSILQDMVSNLALSAEETTNLFRSPLIAALRNIFRSARGPPAADDSEWEVHGRPILASCLARRSVTTSKMIESNENERGVKDSGSTMRSLQKIIEAGLLTYHSLDDVLQTLQMRYRIPLLFDTWTEGGKLWMSGPQQIQPWDEIRTLQKLNSSESLHQALVNYICFAFASTQQKTASAYTHENGMRCTLKDSERVPGVLRILNRLQEIRDLERAQRLLSKANGGAVVGIQSLTDIMRNTVKLEAYLREGVSLNNVNRTIHVVNLHSFELIGDLLRQIRTSDLQDYITFSIIHKYGMDFSSLLRESKANLYKLVYGGIGLEIIRLPYSCIWDFPSPTWKNHIANLQSKRMQEFIDTVNRRVLLPLKETYQEFFKQSDESANLLETIHSISIADGAHFVSERKALPIPQYEFQQHEQSAYLDQILDYHQFMSIKSLPTDPCTLLNDIGLCTYGDELLFYDSVNHQLKPSVLLLFDQKVDLTGTATKLIDFATIGYWVSVGIAEAVMQKVSTFDGKKATPESLASPLKELYLCSTSQHADELNVALDNIRTLKLVLAVEMLTRSFLTITKMGNDAANLPGVYLSVRETYFIFLLQTLCPNSYNAGPSATEDTPAVGLEHSHQVITLTSKCYHNLKAVAMSPSYMSLVGCPPDVKRRPFAARFQVAGGNTYEHCFSNT